MSAHAGWALGVLAPRKNLHMLAYICVCVCVDVESTSSNA